jgi:hypothetical protein
MKLNWALDKEHAETPHLLDREIIWFDIIDLLNHIEKPWKLDPDDLKHRGKKKVEKAKEHFENGGWMDVVDVRGRVSVEWPQHPDDHRIMIENRHRLIAALELGATYAPFAVPDYLVKELKSATKFIPPYLLSVSIDSRP